MPQISEVTSSFEEVDQNRDGTIDQYEFDRWRSNTGQVSSPLHHTSTSTMHRSENTTSQFGRNRYATYETVATSGDFTSEKVVQTNSLEETNRYLSRAVDIYHDPDPLMIRKAAVEGPITYQQRVFVRYLQPPALPAPGPLIVKEVRASQPPPPPPLIIRQYAAAAPSPPPLILRERPPARPPIVASETITRQVPALPPPPRSVVIERFAPPPEKPRDIIIERWLPYEPPPERRTIVEEAPAAVAYAEARNQIITYDGAAARVVKEFKNEGVVREDPADYIARYGDSLFDPVTLVQMARHAGVLEDLSPPVLPYSKIRESTVDYELSNGGRRRQDTQYVSSQSSRRHGSFDFIQYGLFPADYTPGMKVHRRFTRPANFIFPSSSMWSTRIAKYTEQTTNGRVTSITVQLIEDGVTVHSRTITKQEYKATNVSSSAPKLAWNDFLQVLSVFMLGNNQKQESDIARAFDILDQGRRRLFSRIISLADGLISPDELRAFLSILTDEYRLDLCVFLADIDGSGQISLSEFSRMVKSGLARDIICECI